MCSGLSVTGFPVNILRRLNMKKLMAAMLAGTMLIGTAGCGKEKTEKTENTDNGELVTLRLYMPGDQQSDLEAVMEEFNKIAEKEIGARVEMAFIDTGAYTEKMNMKLATKEDFDLCFTGYVNPYGTGVKNESYYPLTELIDKYAPDLWEKIPDFWWDGARRDGEIYAVPNQQIAATVPSMELDKKWIEKYNLDVDSLKTWDDFEPFMQKIKENEPKYYPTKPWGNYWLQNYEQITTGVGLDLREDKLTAIYQWDADGYQHGLDKLHEWFEKGYFRSDIASIMDDSNDYLAGKYVVLGCGWKPGYESYLNTTLGGDHKVINIGKPYVTSSGVTATMYAINAYSKHPEQAIKFIDLINTNIEAYNLLCYGIEGKHYTRVDDNHIKLDKNSGYYTNAAWKFGNQFNAYLLEGQDDNVWEETKKLNDEAVKSKIIGFVFDSSKVQTELSQMATVIGEYANYDNGSVNWRDTFDEYKTRMMNAGAENVLKEVQRQLDEYAKENK